MEAAKLFQNSALSQPTQRACLSDSEVIQIWENEIRGIELPADVAKLAMAACHVGVCPRVVAGWLQYAVGEPLTRSITDATIEAIKQMPSTRIVEHVICLWRRRIKTVYKTSDEYQWWINYVIRVRRMVLLNE